MWERESVSEREEREILMNILFFHRFRGKKPTNNEVISLALPLSLSVLGHGQLLAMLHSLVL